LPITPTRGPPQSLLVQSPTWDVNNVIRSKVDLGSLKTKSKLKDQPLVLYKALEARVENLRKENSIEIQLFRS